MPARAVQSVAQQVGAMMRDITNEAAQVLPGAEGAEPEPSQPLKARLAEAWQGKVHLAPEGADACYLMAHAAATQPSA